MLVLKLKLIQNGFPLFLVEIFSVYILLNQSHFFYSIIILIKSELATQEVNVLISTVQAVFFSVTVESPETISRRDLILGEKNIHCNNQHAVGMQYFIFREDVSIVKIY